MERVTLLHALIAGSAFKERVAETRLSHVFYFFKLYMCVKVPVRLKARRARSGVPGHCRCWESNSSLLQEESVLLTAEFSQIPQTRAVLNVLNTTEL